MESTKFNIWSRLGIYYLACFCNFSAKAEYDEFEWFRCDACSATFFKINTTLIEKFGKRTNIPGYDFVEVIEEVCATMFTKHEFGVKQHEVPTSPFCAIATAERIQSSSTPDIDAVVGCLFCKIAVSVDDVL
eukprot:TRINITY_DN5358_c0_g1_i1.p1 TRINITY_DN5358_c0_g1~~TRINITY_DN5358_c0_g1_i1.p1  ORF type:complete len:132 (+),score=15.20 TRINITY_DN5358_c0_g1_i1:82-477(+)